MPPLHDAIGYAAAVLTTLSFVPQVWHTWRTRDVGGISLPMYVVFAGGVFLWLVYGLVVDAWPIVVANAIQRSFIARIAMASASVSVTSGCGPG